MSRDALGNYTLPGSVNPVVAGTSITDVWGNTTLNDVAAGLTDSLSRSGKGAMTAQLRLADGTVTVPAMSFSNETTSGLYRVSGGVQRYVVTTTPVVELTATDVTALVKLNAPTPATNVNTVQVPTTAWVNSYYAALLGPTFTGTVTLPATTSIGTVSAVELAFIDGVTGSIQTQIDSKASLVSPALTGTPTAPTPTAGANNTQLATTAFVVAQTFAAVLPGQAGNAGKLVTTNGTAASWTDLKTVGGTALAGAGDVAFKTINSATLVGAGNIVLVSIVALAVRRAFITASTTHTIPIGVTSARVYAVGAGGAAIASTSTGAGGGMGYGDISVVAGDVLTVNIAAGVATVIKSAVTMLTANAASGATAGTASIHASVTNGGAFSGGAGLVAASGGGSSSGSPLGAGVAAVATNSGGSGWGGSSVINGGGGGVGGAGATNYGGAGLSTPSTDPLLADLTGAGGNCAHGTATVTGGNGGPGGGGGFGTGTGSGLAGGRGGFGGGGGAGLAGIGGTGGFGGGGGSGGIGGVGGFGGGGGLNGSSPGAGGASAVLIFY